MTQGKSEKLAACYQFEAGLSAFLEGDDRPQVSAHAQQCPICRTTLADLELIRSVSRQLPLEEPPPSLWANVRAQLAVEGILREQSSGWYRWLERLGVLPNPAPAVVMACLAILALVLVVPPGTFILNGPPPQMSSSGNASGASSLPDSDEVSTLASAVREVETTYKARETSLEPTVKATYRKSLESLDTSIRECRDSIKQEPTNTLAHEYLLSAYVQKAQVLTTALEYDAR